MLSSAHMAQGGDERRLGELTVALPSYGTAVMLGFLLATWVAVRQADRTGPAALPGWARPRALAAPLRAAA